MRLPDAGSGVKDVLCPFWGLVALAVVWCVQERWRDSSLERPCARAHPKRGAGRTTYADGRPGHGTRTKSTRSWSSASVLNTRTGNLSTRTGVTPDVGAQPMGDDGGVAVRTERGGSNLVAG